MAKSPTNFNIYEVLEPLKCSVTMSTDKNVGILIDISDDNDVSEDLSGSHLDSIKKSEFDLVDLYQNIYVTPQHVRAPKGRALDVKDTVQTVLAEKETNGAYKNSLKPLKEADINELLNRFDNNETDSFDKSNYMFEDSLYKYNVPKVLEVPTLYDSSDKNDSENTSTDYAESSVEKSTKFTTDFRNDMFEKVTRDLIRKKSVESAMLQTNCTIKPINNLPVTKSTDYHNDIIKIAAMNLIAKKMTESTQNVNRPQIMSSTLSLNKLPKVENFEKLQTAKLDKKLYAKQRLLKNKREGILYTKGPDLYEKSVVLPQIMKRLASRKQELDEVKLPRRLVLDSGKRSPECSCKCSQQMALNSNDNAAKGDVPSKVNNNLFTVPTTGLKSLSTPQSPDTIKVNPIVVMEDCNKERLLAHRVRGAFERFIQTGSYF